MAEYISLHKADVASFHLISIFPFSLRIVSPIFIWE